MIKFIRFKSNKIDKFDGFARGIFSVAYAVLDGNWVDETTRKQIDDLLNWFSKNLPKPSKFKRKNVGICWFKPTAIEHISKIRQLQQIMLTINIYIIEITTNKPGYKLYEDDFQIVAEPFYETES